MGNKKPEENLIAREYTWITFYPVLIMRPH